MARIQFFEIIDQPWCPDGVRNGITESLQYFLCLANHYGCVVDMIRTALAKLHTRTIVDLCSGSGGPWPRLMREFDKRDPGELRLILTDRHPNTPMLTRLEQRYPGRVTAYTQPVDAFHLPPQLEGFRVMFTSFHHFTPAKARALLEDAMRNKQGIGVFEFTQRSLLAVLLVILSPIPVLFLTPFMRPFCWSRLLWTYIVPAVPVAMLFDGLISCLRTYSPEELEELIKPLRGRGYRWECGLQKTAHVLAPVTYLIGYPEAAPES